MTVRHRECASKGVMTLAWPYLVAQQCNDNRGGQSKKKKSDWREWPNDDFKPAPTIGDHTHATKLQKKSHGVQQPLVESIQQAFRPERSYNAWRVETDDEQAVSPADSVAESLTGTPMKSCGRVSLLLVAASWLFAVTFGLLFLADHASKPGRPASPPPHWPDGVAFARNSAKPTLMMFLHPNCPCSRASLCELVRLMGSERDKLDLSVVFTQTSENAINWSQTELFRNAIGNPDLHVLIDQNGLLAQQFGARTSGQVLIYDRDGVLLFTGGITPGRGHSGDSEGRFMVKTIASGAAIDAPMRCATYGCSLWATSMPADSGRSP